VAIWRKVIQQKLLMNLSVVSQTSLADWQYCVSALTTECHSEHQRWCQPRWRTCDHVLQPVISINTPILKWAQRLTEASSIYHTYIHAYIHPFNGPFSGIKKVKPIWILLKQETVSGSGMSWAICKSAPRAKQITTPAPHHTVFLPAGCPSCHPTNSVKALKALSQFITQNQK